MRSYTQNGMTFFPEDIEKGKTVVHEKIQVTFMNIFDFSTMILTSKGSYSDVFNRTGTTEEAIEACMLHAKTKVNESIDHNWINASRKHDPPQKFINNVMRNTFNENGDFRAKSIYKKEPYFYTKNNLHHPDN